MKVGMSNSATTSPSAAFFEGDELWDPLWKEAAGEATLRLRMGLQGQLPTLENNGGAEATIKKPKIEDPELILYSSWFCPFAQRAWIAAEESGVNYRWVEINPYYVNPERPGGYTKKAMTLEEKRTMNPDFIEASPRGLVPAIKHGDKLIWESLPVSEYIDAVFGGGSLMNRNDPFEVARQQIWCAHCTDRIQKKYYQALVAQNKEAQKSCVEEFYQECRALASAMRDDGPYFNGKEFSLVDVALAPFWQRILPVGGHYFGLTLPVEEPEFQRLEKWWQAVKDRPSVAATIVCEPRLVLSYQDYPHNVATSDAAKNYFK